MVYTVEVPPPEGQVEEVDECKNYIDSRCLSAPEGCHDIFGYPIQQQDKTVVRLPVFLPGQEYICFNANASLDAIRQQMEQVRLTQLTAWFGQCIIEDLDPSLTTNQMLGLDPDTGEVKPAIKDLTYVQVPKYYTWNAKEGWKRRKHNKRVTVRLHEVLIRDVERYSLRILLHHVQNCFSYEAIRTYEDRVYPTFQAAAIARGLMEYGEECRRQMEEAKDFNSGAPLRLFFVSLLLYNCPPNPLELFEEFKHHLCLDYILRANNGALARREMNEDSPEIMKQLLIELQRQLQNHQKSLEDFGLPLPPDGFTADDLQNEIIRRELDFDAAEQLDIFNDLYAKLNAQQKLFVDACIEKIKVDFMENPDGLSDVEVQQIREK